MGERTGPLSEGHESPADIRRDIAETQREMSHTIDEIQYRLSPAHMKAQARESVRRAGVRTTRTTIDRVKANPLGAALVGAGLYLLLRNQEDGHDYNNVRYGADFDAYSDRYSAQGAYRDLDFGDESGSTIADAKDRVNHAMGEAASRVTGAVGDVRGRASHVAESAADQARMLRDRAAHRARTASMHGRDMLMDNPLVGGLAAVALGALVGAMLPETRRENELLGEVSDRVTDRIGEVARTGVDQVKHVASAVTSAAKEAATETARRETKSAKDEIANELGR